MAQLQDIAVALQGMGAGIQGNLPQFNQQRQNMQIQQQEQQRLQQEQQRLQQQRMQEQQEARIATAYQDAAAAKQLADQGNYEGVIRLGLERLQLLRNFPDADPSDTQLMTQLAVAAQNGDEEAAELLKKELDLATEVGRAAGYIETPESEVLSASEVTETGQVIERGPGGAIRAREVEGLRREEEDPSLSMMQRIREDGTIQTIQTDKKGNFFDLQGNEIELDPDEMVMEGTSIQGTPADYGVSPNELGRLRDSEVATKSFIATVGDTMSMLQENPDINTWTARAAGVVNNLQQEVKAFARAAGKEFDENILDPSTHAETFDSLGIENQRMRSIINSLAFQAASAQGQTGRSVSDRDVTRFIREIGADAADPRAFAATLRDVANRSARNFEISYETRLNQQYEGDLGLGQMGGYEEPAMGAPVITSPDDPAYSELPAGAEYIWEGQRYIKRGQ